MHVVVLMLGKGLKALYLFGCGSNMNDNNIGYGYGMYGSSYGGYGGSSYGGGGLYDRGFFFSNFYILNMADKRRYRMGYALAPKKQQSFIQLSLVNLARDRVKAKATFRSAANANCAVPEFRRVLGNVVKKLYMLAIALTDSHQPGVSVNKVVHSKRRMARQNWTRLNHFSWSYFEAVLFCLSIGWGRNHHWHRRESM